MHTAYTGVRHGLLLHSSSDIFFMGRKFLYRTFSKFFSISSTKGLAEVMKISVVDRAELPIKCIILWNALKAPGPDPTRSFCSTGILYYFTFTTIVKEMIDELEQRLNRTRKQCN